MHRLSYDFAKRVYGVASDRINKRFRTEIGMSVSLPPQPDGDRDFLMGRRARTKQDKLGGKLRQIREDYQKTICLKLGERRPRAFASRSAQVRASCGCMSRSF
jgi:hypothetical protein